MAATRRASGRTPLVGLAGWLFADLMLVIMIVAMGSQSDPLLTQNTNGHPPTHRPTGPAGTPPPSATPSPAGPRSVSPNPIRIQVTGSADDPARLAAELTSELHQYAGRQAGVLTFGWGPQSGPDTQYAIVVNGLLSQDFPAMFPPGTPLQNFIDLGQPSGGAAIDIYFYTTA